MADERFFRGVNRMDWLYAVLLQNTCDWRPEEQIVDVANQFGYLESRKFTQPTDFQGPPIHVIVCTDYVFVVSSSTQTFTQWIGNVLASGQNDVTGVTGRTQTYFGSVALGQYSGYIDYLLQHVSGRRVVFIGFSLGGASVTIQQAMLLQREGISSACVAFGSPRPGDPVFAGAFPTENFQRFQQNNDPVAGLPPPKWGSVGYHFGWIPYGELVDFVHIQPGSTLYLPNEIRSGDQIPPPVDVALAFDYGLFQKFHNQDLYARILRKGLPERIHDGDEGYPLASRFDALSKASFFSPFWGVTEAEEPVEEGLSMIQASIYFRVKNDSHLGWQEVYYFSGTDPVVVFNRFNPGSTADVFGKRTAFLTKDCEIYAFRCSNVGDPRTSALKKFTSPVVGAVNNQMVDVEDAIAFFAFNNTRTVKRQMHYRGIPELYIGGSVLQAPGRRALGLINAWHTTLTGFGLRIFKPAVIATGTFSSTTKAAANDPITINLDAPVTIAKPSLVTITASRRTPLLNGAWITPGTGNLPLPALVLSATQLISPAPTTTGKFRITNPVVGDGEVVSLFDFNGVSSKKTGRVVFLRRGRRSARFKHR